KETLYPAIVLEYAQYIRKGYKGFAFDLIDMYSQLDAYMSLAIAGNKYQFRFPHFMESEEPHFSVKNLFHLQLTTTVPNSDELIPRANFLYLTVEKMSAKRTYIKA
ncbi:hypothetical protein, partial [Pseudoalteromonas rubra]|uniref:hypothetical protein n=1 Tax=Pseudoalteromonas rubra TaxID=43658 RepID=UPI00126D61AE